MVTEILAGESVTKFVDGMLSRNAKKKAILMRQLASVLDEIKVDLNSGVIPRQNGHHFITFLNLNISYIRRLDRKYEMLRLEEMMIETKRLVKEADLFLDPAGYIK